MSFFSWGRWACLTIMVLCFGYACSKPTTTWKQPPLFVQTSAKKVLAKVGDFPITADAFLSRYRALRSPKPAPKVFLQRLIDEAMMAQEAYKQKLHRSDETRAIFRKALTQEVMQQDFQKWFNIDNVDPNLVRRFYNDFNHRYNKPAMAKVVHLLVRTNVERWTKAIGRLGYTKAQWKAMQQPRLKRAKALSDKMLAIVIKANPLNRQAFASLVKPYIKQYNTPNPAIQGLWAEHKKMMLANKDKPGTFFVPLMKKWIAKLEKHPLCTTCRNARRFLIQKSVLLAATKKPLSQKARSLIVPKLKIFEGAKRQILRFETLPGFPEKATMGFPAMVEPFTVGTYALKDGGFSKKLVKTVFGYHIIFRHDTIPAKVRTFAQVRDEIRQMLFSRLRVQRYRQWLALRAKLYPVTMYPQRLELLDK